MNDITLLTPLDRWIMARALAGYSATELPKDLSPRGAALAKRLFALEWRDREPVLRRVVTAQELKQVLMVDSETPPPKPPAAERPPYRILRADELQLLPPLTWLVPGEIPEEGLSVIFGESGVGKTFITLDYALRIAQTQPVVYIPTEGEAGYRKRVEAWCRQHGQGNHGLYFVFGGIALHDPVLRERLIVDLDKLKPKLLVLDTLAMAMVGLDENSTRDMGLFMHICRHLIERLQTAVLLVHHTTKSGAWIRGSSALQGNADSMIRVTNADDRVLVECAKTKDEKPFDPRYLVLQTVTLEDGSESLVPVLAEQGMPLPDELTVNQRKLLDLLALKVNRDGASLRDLAEASGISFAGVQRALSNLLRKGLVQKPHGSYAISDSGLQALGQVEDDEAGQGVSGVSGGVSGGVSPQQADFFAQKRGVSGVSANRFRDVVQAQHKSCDTPDTADTPDTPDTPDTDESDRKHGGER